MVTKKLQTSSVFFNVSKFLKNVFKMISSNNYLIAVFFIIKVP